MCTVTFVPVKNGFLLASNRDEKNIRKPSLPPQAYLHGQTQIIYPKDAQAGGTWIALKDNGDAAVLLNGAFKKHAPGLKYLRSRGIVMLDIFSAYQPVEAFLNTSLENIEPFTLILFTEQALTECRWDGSQKHTKHLPSAKAHIWSSATLYSDDVVVKREQWFRAWLAGHTNITIEGLLQFHRFGGDGDEQNDLLMKRENIYQTVSITGLQLLPGSAKMLYHDMVHNLTAAQQLTPAHTLYN